MMAESGGGGDVENPTPPTAGEPSTNPHDTAAGVKNKKGKAIALSAFLVTAVVLAIALGVTLGNSDGGTSSKSTNTKNNNDEVMNNPAPPTANTPAGAPPAIGNGELTGSSPATDDAPGEVTFEVRYLQSTGPLASRVRIANPGVAEGYDSCADLKDDMLNALKYYAYSIIVSERDSGWIRMCSVGETCIRDDMCQTGNCTEGKCVKRYWIPGTPSATPTGGSTPTVGTSHEGDGADASAIPAEDSFDTNTQVQGVDEADVVKANVNYVFAAYGDILWTWNSTDASKGRMSKTQMPREPRDPNCTEYQWPTQSPSRTASPTAPWPTQSPTTTQTPTNTPRPTYTSNTPFPAEGGVGPGEGRARQRRDSSDPYYGSCEPPMPQIQALLLAGSRLTAIFHRPQYYWKSYIEDEDSQPIIISDEKTFIRVYDAENVPTDGGPLTLLGEQEIQGLYSSARSIGPKGVVVSQSYINSWQLVSDLYSYNSQYCGLNSTEYEDLATKTALGMVESATEQLIDELSLQPEGTCDNFFQLAAMQSGNSNSTPNGNFLSQLVQVTTFNMSSDFSGSSGDEPPEIPVDVAVAFASGDWQTVYASQDFVAAANVGYEYNSTSGDWDSATFIQGFDISSATPKPFSYAQLPGSPLNQYSLDLYQNHLRVVTTQSKWWPENWTTNKLWVLKVPERGPDVAVTNPEMELVGETEHLGKPNEQVFAVRFMRDLAYVVTFEQTDPLYVLNVTDHTNPIVLGELQIPGFSSYMHPIQIDDVKMMIGVGRHVDSESREVGAKISLFDVSDPMNPTENATYIDMGAYSSAGSDFYAFRYLKLNQKLILPKSKWTYGPEGNFDGFEVYDVDLGSIAPSYEVQHADSQQIFDWCGYGARMPARSLVFQSQLTTILSHSVISTDLATGARNWNVTLDEGLEKTECEGYFW